MSGLIIVFSFAVSMTLSSFLFHKKNNKRMSIFLAFLTNTMIIGITVACIWNSDWEMRTFGTAVSKVYMPILAIPNITWLNAFILQFVPIKPLSDNS